MKKHRNSKVLAQLICAVGHNVYVGTHQAELRTAQWSALRLVAEAGRESGLIGKFAELQGITPSSASQTFTTLTRRKLIKKVAAADGRARILVLTSAGRAFLRQDPLRRLTRGLRRLPEGHAALLSSVLEGLEAELS